MYLPNCSQHPDDIVFRLPAGTQRCPFGSLIADERVTFREFLKSVLSRSPEFQVAGEASDGPEAVKLALAPESGLGLKGYRDAADGRT